VLAAVLLGFNAGAAGGGGTGTDLGLAARALRLRGLRTASRSAFAAISVQFISNLQNPLGLLLHIIVINCTNNVQHLNFAKL
jgi:hypothetical protein